MSARRDEDFTAYVQTRLAWLRRVGYLLCQDWQQADDLVQNAITSLYVHWRRARTMENVDGYARAILVRAFLNERRGGWARRVTLPGQVPDEPGSAPDADDALDVRGALAALPPRQRATLVLRFPYQLTGLPASWRFTSAPWQATATGLIVGPSSGIQEIGGYPAIGPANGHTAGTIPQIQITPGASKCHFFHGSSTSQRVDLHGVTAILTHFAGDGARPYQGLCVPETDGLHVMFLENPGPDGSFAFGGVTGIFLHHLHLLGPNPANWTTHPSPDQAFSRPAR